MGLEFISPGIYPKYLDGRIMPVNMFKIGSKEAMEMQITEKFDGKMCCEEMENIGGSLEKSATKGNFYFSTSNGNMKFCPFCGKEIDKTIKKQIKR